jgi:hypothetical protein
MPRMYINISAVDNDTKYAVESTSPEVLVDFLEIYDHEGSSLYFEDDTVYIDGLTESDTIYHVLDRMMGNE